MFESPIREPLILGHKTYNQITTDLVSPILGRTSWKWYVTTAITALAMFAGFAAIAYTIWVGIGTWGLNKTVGWAFDITNFVFWIGIGHAGTLISAILLLFRQRWRMAINRAAEAMTIFAVICAGLFPIIHMGRPWLLFWFLPIPNTHGSLWVNFNSPLLWDVFAISTYFTISLLFWYTGLIPDLAMVRDRARPGSFAHILYSILSFGWTGNAKQWQRFEAVSLVLAGLSTPLVLSVHSIVSFDFATSILPGWHTTIFPPYFVAGAIFSGFGMVLTLMIITREALDLKDYITLEHIDAMAKVTLATGMMVGFAYATEFFIAWYSGSYWERYIFLNRAFGPYWWSYWIMVSCNLLIPQVFWIKKLRRSPWFVFIISIFVNIGMWFERFVIIVTSLHRDFLTSSWRMYKPTWVEVTILIGSFGLFLTLYMLFARFFPVIAAAETKSILKTSGDQYAGLSWEAYQAQKRAGVFGSVLQPAHHPDNPSQP
ncbi:MAG: NrfD/PsrC family molybdoenzyme membrane anchor subunit [Bacteroidia bacterium]